MSRLAILALAVLVSGCATQPVARTAPAPQREIDQDHAYMQQVESVAMRRGVAVTWVNPPTRRAQRPGP